MFVLETCAGESVQTSGDYAGCSLDERVNLGDTSAVLQKNMVFIIIGVVLLLGIAAMATVLIMRKNGESTAAQVSWDQPMMPSDPFAAPTAVSATPQVLSRIHTTTRWWWIFDRCHGRDDLQRARW